MATVSAAALQLSPTESECGDKPAREPFRYCLNTSTVQGQKLEITRVVAIAARAGYQGIEPWISELDAFSSGGRRLEELRKIISDAGLTVESAIGFCEWIVDDPARRKKALEEARRNFEQVAAIGGTRLAAPPLGATDTVLDLRVAAERYRDLCELGAQFGVAPEAEVWGFSKTMGRLAEAAYVAIAADHPGACVLADVYHLYKGGSGIDGLRLLSSPAMHVIHMNDYPAVPRESIDDADRVYPGDGVAPITRVLRDLHAAGFRGSLSLELFNRGYWAQDAYEVARTGLQKMRSCVHAAISATAKA